MSALSGNVTTMTAPHLFLDLRTGKKTGTAFFEHEQTVKKVYVTAGDIIFASSNRYEDRLGEYLLRLGIITTAHRDLSEELVRKSGKKQGAVLVEQGVISPQQLIEGVKYQVKQIIFSLFTWRAGAYRFEEGPLPLADIIQLRMSTGNLILDGVHQLDWQIMRKSLPSLKTVLRPVTDPYVLFQSADFTPDQKTVLALIDGKRSMEEICSLSGLGDFNTLKAIYLFLVLQLAVAGTVKSEDEMHFAREAVRETTASEEKKAEKPAAEPSAVRLMVEKAFEEMGAQDHYQVLGVNETAGAPELKKAYFRLAKLYHPDRHFDPDMDDMKDKLEALFTRINQAYNTLTNEAKRSEFDLSRVKSPKKVEFEEDKTDRTGTATDQFNRGMTEFKAGNFWGALEAFTWASRLDPGNSKYYYYQAVCLAQMPRRRHDAEEKFKKAIELESSKSAYYIELGNFYLKAGLKTRALTVFQEALNWDPDSQKAKEGIIAAGGEGKAEAGAGMFKKLFGVTKQKT